MGNRQISVVERSVRTMKYVLLKQLKGKDRHWPAFVETTQFYMNQRTSALHGSGYSQQNQTEPASNGRGFQQKSLLDFCWNIPVGAQVMTKTTVLRGKTDQRFEGPYTVARRTAGAYELVDHDGKLWNKARKREFWRVLFSDLGPCWFYW